MSKIWVVILVVASLLIIFSGCKEAKDVSMSQILQIRDSIPKIMPGGAAIDSKIIEQRDYKIIFSNASIYAIPPEMQQQLALKAGKIVLSIIGKGTEIKTGKFIITKTKTNNGWDKDPEDGIILDMKLDSLMKNDPEIVRIFANNN